MPKVDYKLASIEDIAPLIKVGDRLFDYPIKTKFITEFLNDLRHQMVIATIDEEVIGFASAMIYVHPDKAPTLMINEVSVVAECRNRGVATTLVKFLCEHAPQWDCQHIWIATEQANVAARRAYNGAGGVEQSDPVILINFANNNDKPSDF